jgi:hypothetical protein
MRLSMRSGQLAASPARFAEALASSDVSGTGGEDVDFFDARSAGEGRLICAPMLPDEPLLGAGRVRALRQLRLALAAAVP